MQTVVGSDHCIKFNVAIVLFFSFSFTPLFALPLLYSIFFSFCFALSFFFAFCCTHLCVYYCVYMYSYVAMYCR